MIIKLPLPVSVNEMHRISHAGGAGYLRRRKNEYKKQAWFASLVQHMPKAALDLPARVTIQATFFLKGNRRDEDKLKGGLEWVLDALKQSQPPGDNLEWRQGAYVEKGYFRDDGPDVCRVLEPVQFGRQKDPRLELEILPWEDE